MGFLSGLLGKGGLGGKDGLLFGMKPQHLAQSLGAAASMLGGKDMGGMGAFAPQMGPFQQMGLLRQLGLIGNDPDEIAKKKAMQLGAMPHEQMHSYGFDPFAAAKASVPMFGGFKKKGY